MLRILKDLWDLGVETYDSIEDNLHNALINRGNAMRVKIIRKCRNGNFELKYFDNQLGCWLQGYETENNLRQGVEEGVFVIEGEGSSSTQYVQDNSLLGQARAAQAKK